MTNRYTPLDLVNQALRNLGEQPITTFPDTTNPRASLAAQFYQQARDGLFVDHFWNFATQRVTLTAFALPATTLTPDAVTGTGILFTAGASAVFGLDAVGSRLEGVTDPGRATISALVESAPAVALTPAAAAGTPDATGVTFTAAGAAFVAGDVGALLERTDAPGLARITGVGGPTQAFGTIVTGFFPVAAIAAGAWRLVATDRVTADITTDFAAVTPLAAGAWRLAEAAPAWGFAYRFRLPEDYHSMQRTRESVEYQREGDFFLADEATLSLTYTARQDDVTRWPAFFVEAFVARLTATFCEQTTGQLPKLQWWRQLAEATLKRAKLHDGQEGSAPRVTASDLIRARRGGWRGSSGWR